MFDLSGKRALVTGGSRGIGRMIAEAYVRAGARVYLASRDAAACEEAAAELARHGDCHAVPADLSDESACWRLASLVGEREGAVEILVNNAGVASAAPLADFSGKVWERDISVNLTAVFHLTRALLPFLEAASTPDDPARVINVGSVEGIRTPWIENYAYSASKAAVHHLTRHLANRLAPEVAVNAIAPGVFESRMTAGVLAHHRREITARIPFRRTGVADDVAGPAVFLASRASAYVTGAVLPVDGGYLVG